MLRCFPYLWKSGAACAPVYAAGRPLEMTVGFAIWKRFRNARNNYELDKREGYRIVQGAKGERSSYLDP